MPTAKNQFTPISDLSLESRHFRLAAAHSLSARTGKDVFAHSPAELDAEAAKIKAAPALFAALQKLVADGECYCPENLAVKGPCPHCEARAALALAQKEN